MTINYRLLLDEAMLSIVRKILTKIQDEGLSGEEYFYISFYTSHPEVVLSPAIQKKYPKEITIVLQHQFRNLQVFSRYFSVMISFNNIEETIKVPFSSLTNFIDPLANFSIQFGKITTPQLPKVWQEDTTSIKPVIPGHNINKANEDSNEEKKQSKVIAIDKFRKK